MTSVTSLDSVHILRPNADSLTPFQFKVGYHIYLRHGTSVFWCLKSRLESGPVTAELTTTVVHSYKFLINDVQPITYLLYI